VPESSKDEGQSHRAEPLDDLRVTIYERLMEAQEQIAGVVYARGTSHDQVLAAIDAAATGPSPDERRAELFLSCLAAYVRALGGHVEVRAVFAEESVVVRRLP
jgi:hypothetical protein